MPTPLIKPRTLLLYGDSGSTKTTQLYFLAKWLWESQKLISRVIVSDPGGSNPFIESGMVDRGECQMFDFTYRPKAIADLRRLSRGYWPRLTKTGDLWFQTDDRCLTTPDEWSRIGAYLIDGMTSTAKVLITHASDQAGGLGFKESYEYEEDGEFIRGLQQGHYGIVQKEIYRLHAQGFNCLPVKFLAWTALIGKGDDLRKDKKYGPQMAGNASTAEIPSWFQDTFHMEKIIETNDKGESVSKIVAWFTEHNDGQTDIPYLCKVRVMPEMVPEYMSKFPKGYVPMGFKNGIDKHYRVLEILKKKYEEEVVKK